MGESLGVDFHSLGSGSPGNTSAANSVSGVDFTHPTFFCAGRRTTGQCPHPFDDHSTGTQSRRAGADYPGPFQQRRTRLAWYARRPSPKRSHGCPGPHVRLYATLDYRAAVLRPGIEHSLLTDGMLSRRDRLLREASNYCSGRRRYRSRRQKNIADS